MLVDKPNSGNVYMLIIPYFGPGYCEYHILGGYNVKIDILPEQICIDHAAYSASFATSLFGLGKSFQEWHLTSNFILSLMFKSASELINLESIVVEGPASSILTGRTLFSNNNLAYYPIKNSILNCFKESAY